VGATAPGQLRRGPVLPLAGALALGLLLAPACTTPRVRKEIESGRAFATQARRELALVRDPEVTGLVREVGRRLLAAADPQPYRYRFYVFEDPALDAFAVPGGHVFVPTGALLAVKSTSELAAVLAHEIGHVALRHAIQPFAPEEDEEAERDPTRAARRQLAEPAPRRSAVSALALGHYTQEEEAAADTFAVETLRAAGYCPAALLPVLATLTQEKGPVRRSTERPSTPQRTQALLARRGGMPPCAPDPPASDQRLFAVQERVLALAR
jgi:predicted Zn-dependent protease